MSQARLAYAILLVIPLLFGHSEASADWIDRDSCPITTANADSVPGPMSSSDYMAWYGSNALAVLIAKNGHWYGMGPEYNYRNKFWWWSAAFDLRVEREPKLVITAHRLDAPAPTIHIPKATNAILSNGYAMLTGLEFPTDGCWKVIGEYKGQILSIVVLVGEEPEQDMGGT